VRRGALRLQDPPCDLLTATPEALEQWAAGLASRSAHYRAQTIKHVRAFYAKEQTAGLDDRFQGQ
jgi:hypothetical protein